MDFENQKYQVFFEKNTRLEKRKKKKVMLDTVPSSYIRLQVYMK